MLNNALRCLVNRTTISIGDCPAADSLRDHDNAAGIRDNTEGISKITVKVIPCWTLSWIETRVTLFLEDNFQRGNHRLHKKFHLNCISLKGHGDRWDIWPIKIFAAQRLMAIVEETLTSGKYVSLFLILILYIYTIFKNYVTTHVFFEEIMQKLTIRENYASEEIKCTIFLLFFK